MMGKREDDLERRLATLEKYAHSISYVHGASLDGIHSVVDRLVQQLTDLQHAYSALCERTLPPVKHTCYCCGGSASVSLKDDYGMMREYCIPCYNHRK